MKKRFKIVGSILALLTSLRLFFNIELLLVKCICIHEGHLLEHCGHLLGNNSDPSKDIQPGQASLINLPQNLLNQCTYLGGLVEIIQIVFLLVIIFKWKRFHIQGYFCAVVKLAHVMVWICLLGIFIYATITIKLIQLGITRKRIQGFLIVNVEVILLVILASAWGFIARRTVQAAFIEGLEQEPSENHECSCNRCCGCRWSWVALLMFLYNSILFLYVLRLATFFVYDLSLATKSIGALASFQMKFATDSGDQVKVKSWNSILLLLICAFRGSLAKFFFSKMYQGYQLPRVVDNVPVIVGERELGTVDTEGGRQHDVPWRTWTQEAVLTGSMTHGYDQCQVNSDETKHKFREEEDDDGMVHVTTSATVHAQDSLRDMSGRARDESADSSNEHTWLIGSAQSNKSTSIQVI